MHKQQEGRTGDKVLNFTGSVYSTMNFSSFSVFCQMFFKKFISFPHGGKCLSRFRYNPGKREVVMKKSFNFLVSEIDVLLLSQEVFGNLRVFYRFSSAYL